MPQYCCVPKCTNRSGGHTFPKNQDLRKRWIIACRRLSADGKTQWEPSEHSRVCREHFTKEDYKTTLLGERKKLKEDVVPSVFSLNLKESPMMEKRKTDLPLDLPPPPSKRPCIAEMDEKKDHKHRYVITKYRPLLPAPRVEEENLWNYVDSTAEMESSCFTTYLRSILNVYANERIQCKVCLERQPDIVKHLVKHFGAVLFTCTVPACFETMDFRKHVQHVQSTDGLHLFRYTCLKCRAAKGLELAAFLSHLRIHRVPSKQDLGGKTKSQIAAEGMRMGWCQKAEITCQLKHEIPPAGELDIDSIVREDMGLGNLRCNVCDIKVPSDYDWYRHMQEHLHKTSFFCKKCKLQYTDYILQESVNPNNASKAAVNHDFQFFCHRCKIYHETYHHHLSHLKFHASINSATVYRNNHNGKGMINHCVVCSKVYYDPQQVMLHYIQRHFTSAVLFCRVCFKNFDNDLKKALDHFKIHDIVASAQEGIVLLCPFCGKRENSGDDGRQHIAEHLEETGVSPVPTQQPTWECKQITYSLRGYPHCKVQFKDDTDLCDAQFTDVASLFEHVRDHALSGVAAAEPRVRENNPSDRAAGTPQVQTTIKALKRVGYGPVSESCSTKKKAVLQPRQKEGVLQPRQKGGFLPLNNEGVLQPMIKEDLVHPSNNEVVLQPSASKTDKSAVPNELESSETTCGPMKAPLKDNQTVRRKIKIFVCKTCNKRFVEEHFFSQHLEKAGH